MSDSIRDYEVSVWTLQDSYIATLKWSNSSHKGQIQEPKMTLSDDGTESFSFSIPMNLYVQDGDVLVKKENPIWYTVRDGILMVNMRKIKVIFNKTFDSNKNDNKDEKKANGERIFEFLITKITETHEEDNPTCSVECEGLAFHELGKQGYKIELSSEVFYDRDNTYYNGNTDGLTIWYDNLYKPHADCPKATLDYWMNDLGIKHARYMPKTVTIKQPQRITKEEYDARYPANSPDYFYKDVVNEVRKYYKNVELTCLNGLDETTNGRTSFNPTEWYYDVQIDQSAYSKLDTQTLRKNDKVYEDPYVSSWDKDLNPMTVEPAHEKERMIDANESNLYNLTQTIAENFEIFCRYEYSYDSRYQITGRRIIFYNTFHSEYDSKYFEHINYPQTASSVSREYDGTEITTKMYVRPETDDSSITGQISIIDSNANPTKEDYVMNFDYLHDIGTISDEQYDEIKVYNLKMKHYNEGCFINVQEDSDITSTGRDLQDGYYRKGDRIYRKKGTQWEQVGLITLQEQLLAKSDRKIEIDAKLTVANNSYNEALERINDAKQHIGGDTGNSTNFQHRTADAPAIEVLSKYKNKDNKEFYQLSFSDTGIFPDSIKMYKKWNDTKTTFSDFTSETDDIPESSVASIFAADSIDFTKERASTTLTRYMKVANLDANNSADVNTAKETLNTWYTHLKTPGDQFADSEIPNFINTKITQAARPNGYEGSSGSGDKCKLATDAIGWVLLALGYASYKKIDSKDWKKYVLQVRSPAGKDYFLKSTASKTKAEKNQIDITTWNQWVACRLEWCLAVSKGVESKDIQMTRQSDKSYVVTSKLSWAKLAEGNSLSVQVNNRGRVTWTADISSIGLNEKTAFTFTGLKKTVTPNINYQDLLQKVGIYRFPNQITSFRVVTDENGNPTGIRRIPIQSGEPTLTKVYLTYDYDPITYYTNIRNMWQKKLESSKTDQKLLSEEQEKLENSITNLKEVIQIMLHDKFEDTRKFDHAMGPALRESYWQPEDYHDYGDFYSQHLNPIFFNEKNIGLPTWRDEQISAGFFWDNELFPEEEKGYFFLGVDTGETAQKHFYPCIDLLRLFKSCEETAADSGENITIGDPDETITVEDTMEPITGNLTQDGYCEGIPEAGHELGEIGQGGPFEFVGSGVLTMDIGGNSYISGIKSISDTSMNIDRERKLMHEQYNDTKIPAPDSDEHANAEISNTQIIESVNTMNFIEQFIEHFPALTFSYYNDNFDKQVQKSSSYNAAKQEYQINNTNTGEYQYDQSLYAAVIKEDNEPAYIQWAYKIQSLATTSGEDSKPIINTAEVTRSESDRVFLTVGSKTAGGAFVENDEVKLMFLRRTEKDTHKSIIMPVLMLKGLDGVPDSVLHYIQQPINYDKESFFAAHNNANDYGKYYRIHPGAQPMLGFYNQADSELEFSKIANIQPKHWVKFDSNTYDYEVVYPRIKINSLQLKSSTVALTLNYDPLQQYEDYYIFTRRADHLITIKPYVLFEPHGSVTAVRKKLAELGATENDYFISNVDKTNYYLASSSSTESGAPQNGFVSGTVDFIGTWMDNPYKIDDLRVPVIAQTNYIDEISVVLELCFFSSILEKIQRPLRITYAISNGGTRTYLDAVKVVKENSQPKVTYNVTPNIANSVFTHTLYNKLGQIVGINDAELKFKNVFGYISSVELDLDKPWEDSIEVKNYTNKFEDLFSSITAQTEAMKKNSGIFASFGAGNIPAILQQSVAETVTETVTSPSVVSNIMAEFDGPEVVQSVLLSILEDAFEILDAGQDAINELASLNSENANKLGQFVQNVSDRLKPQVFSGDPSRITNYKPGDICYGEDGRLYVAASGDAFMPVYDGNVSSIVGATVNWDAESGIVNVEGATKINIKSGNNIDIAASSDINIIGNKTVNIGGATINIGSAVFEDDEVVGSINIVSSILRNTDEEVEIGTEAPENNSAIPSTSNRDISGIFINPAQISMLSSNIIMEGGEKITMYTSDGTRNGTAAFQISTTEGIWMGSGKGIEIYADSSSLTYDLENQVLSQVTANGASVSIRPERILMGIALDGNSTVIRLKSEELIIAAGSQIINPITGEDIQTPVTVTGTSSGLVGARFTEDSIGLATKDTNNTINAILMNENGITIGGGIGGYYTNNQNQRINLDLTSSTDNLITGDQQNSLNGSWVRINADGIALGSMADLYLNTNNIKMQTKSDGPIFVVGTDLQSSGAIGDQGVGIAFVGGTLTVKGIIQAESLILSSNAQATMESIITGKVSGTYIGNLGFYTKTEIDGKNYTTLAAVGDRIWAELKGEGNDGSVQHTGWSITSSGMSITSTGAFTVSAGNFQLDSSGNIKMYTTTSSITQTFYVGNSPVGTIVGTDNQPVKFDSDSDSGVDDDATDNMTRAFTVDPIGASQTGLGLLTYNKNFGISVYDSGTDINNQSYSGGAIIKGNCDVIGDGIRAKQMIASSSITSPKFYVSNPNSNPKIIWSFTRDNKNHQGRLYLTVTGGSNDGNSTGKLKYQHRWKNSSEANFPSWGSSSMRSIFEVQELQTDRLRVNDNGTTITRISIDNTAATGTTKRYIHFYAGSYIYTVEAIRTSNT